MKVTAVLLLQCSLLLLLINFYGVNAGPGDLILGKRVDRDVSVFNQIVSLPALPFIPINFPFIHLTPFGRYSFINATAIEPGNATLLSGGIDNIFVSISLKTEAGKPLRYAIQLFMKPFLAL